MTRSSKLTMVVMVAVIAGCGRTELVRYSLERPDASVDAGGVDAGIDAGRPDAGLDAGVDSGIPCMPRNLPTTPAFPTAVFVIDHSGSMTEDLDGTPDAGPGRSRWEVLRSSLTSVLPPLDQQISMGALIYPIAGDSCAVPAGVNLTPMRGNSSALLSLFVNNTPRGGTPTSVAVQVAANHLLTQQTASGARALILATDGAPNCNEFLDQDTCVCSSTPMFDPNCDTATSCLDDTRTVSSIRQIFQQSQIPTYVIGLGSSLNMFASTLDQMAIAGGAPRMGAGPKYYSVSNQAELTDALTRVTSQLTKCTYLVSGVNFTDLYFVRVGGMLVPMGASGWEWLDQSKGELVFRGMSCDVAATGAPVTVTVECN